MKKFTPIIISFFCFQLITFSLSAQKMLKNREVYSFNPGDVFEYKMQALNSPIAHARYTVMAKTLSTNSDTLKYSFRRRTYYATGSQNIFDKTDTVISAYYNLDSLVIPPTKGQPGIDSVSITSWLDSDKRVVNEIYTTTMHHPGENDRSDYQYKENLGQTVQSNSSDGNGSGYQILVYYKQGNQIWGQSFFTGIQEQLNSLAQIEIYPNPLHNGQTLNIKNLPPQVSSLQLYDIEGRQLQIIKPKFISNGESEVDNLQIPRGVYLLRAQNENGIFSYKIVCE